MTQQFRSRDITSRCRPSVSLSIVLFLVIYFQYRSQSSNVQEVYRRTKDIVNIASLVSGQSAVFTDAVVRNSLLPSIPINYIDTALFFVCATWNIT